MKELQQELTTLQERLRKEALKVMFIEDTIIQINVDRFV